LTTYGLDDLGEHAVRLGSPHLWDRRGDTILLDSFEEGMGQCWHDVSGGAGSVDLVGAHAWQSAFSLKITTGSDDERFARIGYNHGYTVSSGLGLEFTFTIPEVVPLPEPTTAYWMWTIEQITLTEDRIGWVRYNLREWTLEYYDLGGNWVEFAPLATGIDISNRPSIDVWQTGKLVIDYFSLEYRRFILNDREWNLTGIPFYRGGAGGTPLLAFISRLEGQADENQVGYLDAVCLTQNEL